MPIFDYSPLRVPDSVDWVEPTRLAAIWRAFKSTVHVILRAAKNAVHGPVRITRSGGMDSARIIAEHRSPLWVDGREDEFVLRCGKVQNLRVAVRRFDGIRVPAGQVLSFWSQLGRPSRLRGYAVGREVINGCIVPTVGGGLCQLSGALADAASTAGIQLVERHRHSALIEQHGPNTLAVDATVAWNYVDLRLQADFDFSIEALLTHDELIVRVRSNAKMDKLPVYPLHLDAHSDARPVARGCLTCDQLTCFRHRQSTAQSAALTAFLLAERSPEFALWLQENKSRADWFLPWLRPGRRQRGWTAPRGVRVHTALWPGLKRTIRQQLLRGEGGMRQAGRIQAAAELAHHYAQQLRPEHVDLVISQELAAPLWRAGALGGRSYDVLVSELPASEIQARLNAAASADPQAASLRDFRIDADWQKDEWAALAHARRRISSHPDIHRVLQAAGLGTELLPWCTSAVAPVPRRGTRHFPTLAFAASALPRKGSREVAEVARRLAARVLILGTPPGNADAWAGVAWSAVGYSSDWLAQADAVVLPAYIEHQPRAALRALKAGIPVVASPACGLGAFPGVKEVEAGNADSLEHALRQILVGLSAEV